MTQFTTRTNEPHLHYTTFAKTTLELLLGILDEAFFFYPTLPDKKFGGAYNA